MKPRIKAGKFVHWLCFDDQHNCIGCGDTPKQAYEEWAWLNKREFIPSYSKEDNQDQTRRET